LLIQSVGDIIFRERQSDDFLRGWVGGGGEGSKVDCLDHLASVELLNERSLVGRGLLIECGGDIIFWQW
jgi:hypothetical protein